MKEGIKLAALCGAVCGALLFYAGVAAEQYSGGSYIINGNLGTSTGEAGASASYQLETTSGEPIVGNAAGGSYKLFQGYLSDPTPMMRLSIDPSGLVANYPLNETTGTTALDYSSYRAYGTYVNAPTAGTGKLGNALTFDGATQAVSIGNTAQTQLASTGTVEAWVKSSVSTGSQAIVAKASNFWLGLSAGTAATYTWGSGVTCADTTNIANGTWHHIALTLNSGVTNGTTLYVDGTAKKTCTWSAQAQTGQLTIGAVYSASVYSQYLNGSVDHVKLFNRILSAAEIKAEYTAQNAGNSSGLALGQITPGVSNTTDFTATVATNSNDYSLSLSQDHDLQQASYTIPAIGSLVTSPAAWVEGTTKGLGFTLVSGPGLDSKWSTGANYAALPGLATTFYSRNGAAYGSSDTITMRIRADAAITQVSGDYSNIMTITGTTIP